MKRIGSGTGLPLQRPGQCRGARGAETTTETLSSQPILKGQPIVPLTPARAADSRADATNPTNRTKPLRLSPPSPTYGGGCTHNT
jgi:hypothetical protein